jgi:hypothetical protein
MKYPLAILAAGLVAGCTTPGSGDCESDWRSLGQRDGRIGASSQVERYAAKCGKAADEAAYAEGYREGFARRPYIPSF